MNLHQYAETHEVTNQVPSLDGANLYRLDLPLQEWVRRYQGGWAERLAASWRPASWPTSTSRSSIATTATATAST